VAKAIDLERTDRRNLGIGARLQAVRVARGYSLKEVAEGAELSASFLSMVENEQCDITVGRLLRLLVFYGVGISELVPDGADTTDDVVVRRADRRHIDSASEGVQLFLLAPELPRIMSPELLVFEPGAVVAEFDCHDGEEFIYVKQGTIELILEGREPIALRTGDSAYYAASRPHMHRNVGKTKATMLAVVTPPRI
jgi:quercetin dioxygenase-like cupin family protein